MADQAIGILATGSYLPKEEVTNDDLRGRVSVTPEWIERKTEIRSRRWAGPDEACSDLAARAVANALDAGGLTADQLDYLIVATSTGDFPQPPTASVVQAAIGAGRAACFDINAVCSGFVYALAVARGLVAARPASLAVVVGVDMYSRILDLDDHRTAILMGDGAGAAVVGPVADGRGILDVSLVGRGDANHLIRVEAGGSRLPTSAETVAAGGQYFRMDGRGVRDFVMAHVPPVVTGLLERSGVEAEMVRHVVPHQPNGVLLRQLVDLFRLPNARTHRTLEKYGNIGCASIPVVLDEANRAGALADGDVVLLAGFGGGMTVGTALLRWHGPR